MHKKILAISTGWNWSEPTCTQSRAPLMDEAEVGDERRQEQDRRDSSIR